jgi:UDP-GlcNAc:undecaprenyl-phosphate/decaprenyl-phosphate GlcNAc-1-phosphate transferase
LGIAAIAGHNGDFLVTSFALAVGGAAIGFLRYNVPPARIFLGDAGSMLLGFLLAALTLKLDLPVGETAPRVLSTVLLVAVPLFDLTVVVVARLVGGRPLMRGGTDHTTHRLRRRGLSARAVLATMIVAQGACSALAYLVYQQPHDVVLVVGGVLAAAWVALLVAFVRMPEPAGAQGQASAVPVST